MFLAVSSFLYPLCCSVWTSYNKAGLRSYIFSVLVSVGKAKSLRAPWRVWVLRFWPLHSHWASDYRQIVPIVNGGWCHTICMPSYSMLQTKITPPTGEATLVTFMVFFFLTLDQNFNNMIKHIIWKYEIIEIINKISSENVFLFGTWSILEIDLGQRWRRMSLILVSF